MARPLVAVVNDSYDTIERLTRALQQAGYDVIGIAARDLRRGAVGLAEVARAQQVSAIVYDVGVPYRENWEYLRRIRSTNSDLPPLVITTPSKRVLDTLVADNDLIEACGDAIELDRVVAAVRKVVQTSPP